MQGTYWRFSQRSSYLCARKNSNKFGFSLAFSYLCRTKLINNEDKILLFYRGNALCRSDSFG